MRISDWSSDVCSSDLSPFLPSASSADPSALTVVQGERPVPKLTIRQWPLPIETGKATILDAALDRGVPFPHGCRTGECGTCKCLLLSGDVAMKNYDSAALSASETASGFVLPCRARPRGAGPVPHVGGTPHLRSEGPRGGREGVG